MGTFKRLAALAGSAALLSAAAVAVPGPAYAAAGCQVSMRITSFSPFTGDMQIVNTGDPITGGWTLTFAWTAGQRIVNGWPVTFTQPPGSNQVTVAGNAPWNSTLATGVPFAAGFVGTSPLVYKPPTGFRLNGTPCIAAS